MTGLDNSRAALVSIIAGIAGFFWSGAAMGASYTLPQEGDDVIGAVTYLTLKYEDSLASIAEKYGIGFRELVDANRDVDPWLPGEGTRILLPTEYVLPTAVREGLVINIPEYRLYYYPPDRRSVITYPVGVGRTEFPTPVIKTSVVGKIVNPSWTPTPAARREHAQMGDPLPLVVPPGPDNPLGHLAIQLAAQGYFIHGTNSPFGVGQMVSHGCIRLYPTHIETLAEIVPNGTPVYIVNEPFKVGWRGDHLYAEAHANLYAPNERKELVQGIVAATEKRAANVDWQRVDELGTSLTGVPVRL